MATAKVSLASQNAVAETLLIALCARALEVRQPIPLIRDDAAAAIVGRINYDFTRFTVSKLDRVTTAMRVRAFDGRTRDFLVRSSSISALGSGWRSDDSDAAVSNSSPRHGRVPLSVPRSAPCLRHSSRN